MLHVNLHLERMADYCVTVAKLTKLAGAVPADAAHRRRPGGDGRARRGDDPRRARSFEHRDLARAEALVELDELIDRANRRLVERVLELASSTASGACACSSSRAASSGSATMRSTSASRPPISSPASSASSRTRPIRKLSWLSLLSWGDGSFWRSPARAAARPGVAAKQPVVRFAFAGDIAMVTGPGRLVLHSVRRDLTGDVVWGTSRGR